MPSRTVNGIRIDHDDAGEGTPLVLLHAFPLSRRMWSAQAELEKRCRLILPDLRGFGDSGDDGETYSIDRLAEDLHTLLHDIGALPAVVGGVSMGGYVSLAFARKFPADFRGMILIDTRPDADTPQAREARQRTIDLVREKGPAALADQMIPKLLAPGADEGRPELARGLRKMIESASPATIIRGLGALRDRADSTPILPTISVPTLVVVGEGDQITPVELSQQMCKAIPGARLAVVRGAGHLSPMEQPGQVNQIIGDFLGSIGRRQR